MSVSLWSYEPEKCDGEPCCGDCDKCKKADEEKAGERMNELERATDVNFFALKSQYNNCICSACHNGTKVLRLQLPETYYRPPKYKLKTEYREYWLCGDCLNKLRKAIRESWGGNE